MPGTTPIYSLPYPVSSDLVSAYPALGQDLAEDLDDILAAKLDASSQTIIQVVSANLNTEASSTSSSYVDTGLTATITPTSASNKVLVLVSVHYGVVRTATASNTGDVRWSLARGASNIAERYPYVGAGTNGTNPTAYGTLSWAQLDSPATTSATTYKVQQKIVTSNCTVYTSLSNYPSSITLLEVKG